MPTFRLATPEEQAVLDARSANTPDLSAYHAAIAQLVAQRGDSQYSQWSRIDLDEGESRKSVLRRFTMAAKVAGVSLGTRPDKGSTSIVWLRLRPAPNPSVNGPVVAVKTTKKAAATA